MKKFSKMFLITVGILAIVSAILMTVSVKLGSSAVNGPFSFIMMPAQTGASFVINTTENIFINIAKSGKNARENAKLKKTVSHLKTQISMVEDYKSENEKLRKMLELKDVYYHDNGVAANIIGKQSGDLYSVITIDKGTDDGIRKNSVAVTPDGLVGVVCEEGKFHSKIKTLLDASSSVSAVCVRSNDMGVAEGSVKLSKSGKCLLNYLDKEAKIVVGDTIETSGTGGIFPRGIQIGKVVSINEDSRKLTLSAVIKTSVKINNIGTVLVYR